MNSNGKAIATNESLAQTMSKEEQQYSELLEFKRDYQNGTRNVFVYAPERLNVRQLMAGAQDIAGAFYPTAPDQFFYSTLTGSKTRKLGEDPNQITLDVNYTVLPNYASFSDTSIGDFTVDVYFTLASLYSDSYLENGLLPLFSINVEPLLVFYAGKLTWLKSTSTLSFRNYNTSVNLKDTIQSRPVVTISGVNYPDFTSNPTKLTIDQYKRFIIDGDRPIAAAVTFNATGMNASNAAFLAANFYGQVSYSFNYYALLANF